MEQLVREGKVLYVGSSNFAGWHIVRANERARGRYCMGLVSEQSLYNLTERTIELEVIPACESYGVGVLPWSPLAGGVLGGALSPAAGGRRASERIRARAERMRPQLEQYEGLCRQLGHEPGNVALSWLLTRPAVTAPIIGPRTVAQLDDATWALGIELDEPTLARLDAIFPGPGAAAPEAYAW
jgi:aryl-alcohol dehydrogenase-like predicted oxidoreductase